MLLELRAPSTEAADVRVAQHRAVPTAHRKAIASTRVQQVHLVAALEREELLRLDRTERKVVRVDALRVDHAGLHCAVGSEVNVAAHRVAESTFVPHVPRVGLVIGKVIPLPLVRQERA